MYPIGERFYKENILETSSQYMKPDIRHSWYSMAIHDSNALKSPNIWCEI